MKVGILGSGDVGKALAKGFAKHGYEVMVGSRDIEQEKMHKIVSETNGKAKLGTFNDAAKFGNLLVLAVKGTVAVKVIESISRENLKNKTIIDATNPIADAPPENGVIKYFTTLENSLMEQLQSAMPEANFVKAFNSIGNADMVNPSFSSKPTMFICGNNEEAKKQVTKIVEQFGFEAEDMGKVEAARAIEPLCILWCIPGFLRNDWNHAFKLLKR
ncbi:MAG: NAD(P)-binding domain-containing protein [archaeon]|nr:NAD(P)-binding domain-containing protein [archaeon]